jgi:hypothetical protein
MTLRRTRQCLGAFGALLLTGTELLVAAVAHLQDLRFGAPLADLLAAVASVCALALGLWLLVGLGSALLAAVPGPAGSAGRGLQRCAPGLCRRWAAVLLGVSIGAVAGSSAATAAVPAPPVEAAIPAPGFMANRPLDQRPAPGWTPRRPPRPVVADPGLVSGQAKAPAGRPEVVVHRGDSLWSIVRRALGPEASDVEVARAWPRWYAANRATIGDDPGLLLPGQRLHRPLGSGHGAR